MDYKSSFHAVVATVRPLMKGTRNLGEFTAGLIDMGLVPRGTVDCEKTALEVRKSATWKGHANGSDQLPTVLASELAGRWDQFRFAGNVSQERVKLFVCGGVTCTCRSGLGRRPPFG